MTSPRDRFFSPLRSDKGWKGCRGTTPPPGWDSLQDWALAHCHLESSLCSREGSGPLHEDCSPLPLPWPQGSFLGLTEENLVGLLEVKHRTVWASPDTVANRSFWPSQESSGRLSHTSASSECCCQLTSPPAPAPGEQILAWPPYILCLSRFWSDCLCAPHFSMLPDFRLFSFSWFYGWKWTFQSSVCQSWNQEFRALKNEDRKAARTQILTIYATPPSLVK